MPYRGVRIARSIYKSTAESSEKANGVPRVLLLTVSSKVMAALTGPTCVPASRGQELFRAQKSGGPLFPATQTQNPVAHGNAISIENTSTMAQNSVHAQPGAR